MKVSGNCVKLARLHYKRDIPRLSYIKQKETEDSGIRKLAMIAENKLQIKEWGLKVDLLKKRTKLSFWSKFSVMKNYYHKITINLIKA